jgi:hypothetical protein
MSNNESVGDAQVHHASADHACDQLELLKGLADFCEDWVEQLHELGLKNNRRTKTIRNRDRKYKLYTQWEHLSGNREVQGIKKQVNKKRKRNLQNSRGADTAAALLLQKNNHRQAALQQAMDWGELTIKSRGDYKARCVR